MPHGVKYPVATCWPVSGSAKVSTPVNGRYVDGEVLVRFKTGVGLAEARAVLSRHGMKISKGYTWVENLFHVRLRPGLTVETAIEALKAKPDIEYAEPNQMVESDPDCPTPCIPNDPAYVDQ